MHVTSVQVILIYLSINSLLKFCLSHMSMWMFWLAAAVYMWLRVFQNSKIFELHCGLLLIYDVCQKKLICQISAKSVWVCTPPPHPPAPPPPSAPPPPPPPPPPPLSFDPPGVAHMPKGFATVHCMVSAEESRIKCGVCDCIVSELFSPYHCNITA